MVSSTPPRSRSRTLSFFLALFAFGLGTVAGWFIWSRMEIAPGPRPQLPWRWAYTINESPWIAFLRNLVWIVNPAIIYCMVRASLQIRWFTILGFILLFLQIAADFSWAMLDSIPIDYGRTNWWMLSLTLPGFLNNIWTIAALMLLKPPPGWSRFRRGLVLTAIFTATTTAFLVEQWLSHSPVGDPTERTVRLARAPLDFAAIAAILWWSLSLFRKPRPTDGPLQTGSAAIACPRCTAPLTIPPGDSIRCTCGLQLELKLSEARCQKCRYLLRGLTSPHCPECGTPVPSAASSILTPQAP